jgi:hypothetical protein
VLHHIIKGSFQRRLEQLLPPDIHVQVLSVREPSSAGLTVDAPPPAEPAPASRDA